MKNNIIGVLDSKTKNMYDDYKNENKNFNNVAPDFLKMFGFNDKEINDCISDIEIENKKRDEIINKLIDTYGLRVYKSDFPIITYVMKNEEVELFIEHDCSRWIWIKDSNSISSESFDPLDNNCYEDLCNKIEEFNKSIKI